MKRLLFLNVLFLTNMVTNAQNYKWAGAVGGPFYDYVHSVITDTAGNIYTVGDFSGTADFDPGPGVTNLTSSGGGSSMFIQKLSRSGSLIWAKQVGGPGNSSYNFCSGNSIKVNSKGQLLIGGRFAGTKDFEPNSGTFSMTSSVTDAFILSLDSAGIFLWAKQLTGSSASVNVDVLTTDASDNIYLTGGVNNRADFDPGPGTYFLGNGLAPGSIYVLKLDSTGSFAWAKEFWGSIITDAIFMTCMKLDGSGNILLAGYYAQTARFGNYTLTVQGDSDDFIAKLDPNGNCLWARTIGNGTPDHLSSLTIDVNDNLYVTGDFTGTVDFDPGNGTYNLTSKGAQDIFVQKLNSNGDFVWAKNVGGRSTDLANTIDIDAYGALYVTGNFFDTSDFDPSHRIYKMIPVGQGGDVFILKLDANGNFVYASQFGGISANGPVISSVCFDQNDIVVAGTFRDSVDFDPGPGIHRLGSNGASQDFFVEKLSQAPASLIFLINEIRNNPAFDKKILWLGSTYYTSPAMKICADGSQATSITFVNKTGIASGKIRFWIQSDTFGYNAPLSGYFISTVVSGDTITAELAHPTYLPNAAGLFHSDNIRIVDTSNSYPDIYSIPIHMYRAPVLMMHGLWGNREALDSMEVRLDRSGYYRNVLTYRGDYESSNDREFEYNASVIPNALKTLFQQCRDSGYSLGKVDLICHSMGGLLGRQYLQSDSFRYDVHKFITLNTPHAGSQSANFLLTTKPSLNLASIAVLRATMNLISNNCERGAVEDLKVYTPGSQIEKLADGHNYSNYNNIGVHAIGSTTVFPFTVPADVAIGQILQSKAAGYGLFVPIFLSHLFQNEGNDCIVAESSQRGGLPLGNYSLIIPQYHESCRNTAYQAKIDSLLEADPNGSFFAHTGFVPPILSSSYKILETDTSTANGGGSGSIVINSPTNGTIYGPGQMVNVSVTTTGTINNIMVFVGNRTIGTRFIDTNATAGTFSIQIPDDAIGVIKLVAVGSDDSGLVAIDSLTLSVNVTSPIDSIHIYPEEAALSMKENFPILVTGYFRDGIVRNISYLPNIVFQLDDTTVAFHSFGNFIFGKRVGRTALKVSYLNDTASVPVVVMPADPNYPPTGIHSHNTFPGSNTSNGLRIFPNPNRGAFTIQLPSSAGERLRIEVFSQLGQRILSQEVLSASKLVNHSISLKNAKNGFYVVFVTTLGRHYSQKIVVLD